MNLEQVINDNQRLVYAIANNFPNYKNKEDLYQAGYLGIIKAFNNFDVNQNCKFSTYAYTYIFGEMKKIIREDKGYKVSRSIGKLNLLIENAYMLLSQKLMRKPTIQEIAQYLNEDEYNISEAIMSLNTIKSIDEPIIDDGNCTLQEVIGYSNNIDDLIMLKDSLLKLKKDERELINNRYIKDYTQMETSSLMNMSQVQVSRKEKKILQKLRAEISV